MMQVLSRAHRSIDALVMESERTYSSHAERSAIAIIDQSLQY